MSLDTYSGLQTFVANWLRRTDLTSVIPDFITLAEAEMNRRLRCQRMLSRGTLNITSQLVGAPADFIAPKSLRLSSQTNSPVVRWVSDQQMDDLLATQESSSGVPLHYTLEGGSFRFSPDPGTGPYTGSLSYYAKVPALSSNASNWVLASHPDAYKAGALAYAYGYLRQPELGAASMAEFISRIDAINASDTGIGTMDVMPNTYGAGYI